MDRQQARDRARKIVDQMTVEELASQLKFDAEEIERLGIPEYNWWNEGLHGVARSGVATMFPQAIGIGATFDDDLVGKMGKVVATEARAKFNEQKKRNDRDIYKGITLWSPNINLFRDPRWGRGHETYGEDPHLITRLGVAYIKGLQGDGEYLLTAACAKHFAVHSGPEGIRHTFDVSPSKKDLWETYLPQFEAAVKEAGVESVMGAYNRVFGEPACANTYLMQEVLRKEWGFEGHFVSDCWAVRDFHENHKVTSTPEESVKLALEKGCDLNCGCTYQKIMDAYNAGMIDIELLKKSAVNVIATRILLGMFDETEYDSITYEVIECKEHLALADRATTESIVLLKNNGILPLNKDKIRTIGVVGPNANSRASLIGNYHGTSSRYITVLEGIQDYVGDDVRVFYSEGCHLFLDRVEPLARPDDRRAEVETIAQYSDLLVVCVGLDEGLEGEEGDTGNAYASGDKGDLLLPKSQRILLENVAKCGKPFIVINMSGSAMDLSFADEKADAVVQAWYPGARGGRIIASMLFGDVSPSGKLPVTFYRDLNDMPAFEDYSMKNRTYRYIQSKPLYPFGYGLTYGKCKAVSAENASGSFAAIGETGVDIKVKVTNEGNVKTEDVLQIYVRTDSKNEVPGGKLGAFKRISLEAGETKELTVTVPYIAFTTVDAMGQRSKDGSKATLYVGFSQPDARSKELTGIDTVTIVI